MAEDAKVDGKVIGVIMKWSNNYLFSKYQVDYRVALLFPLQRYSKHYLEGYKIKLLWGLYKVLILNSLFKE